MVWSSSGRKPRAATRAAARTPRTRAHARARAHDTRARARKSTSTGTRAHRHTSTRARARAREDGLRSSSASAAMGLCFFRVRFRRDGSLSIVPPQPFWGQPVQRGSKTTSININTGYAAWRGEIRVAWHARRWCACTACLRVDCVQQVPARRSSA